MIEPTDADAAATSSMSKILKSGPIFFGPFLVTPQVFHLTPLSFGLVNLKPILPGHVLVCSRRRVPRVSDLTPHEVTDLFLTVRRVARTVERVYGASSLNIAIQDGVDAGQSVPHVHAHIIPRRKADLDARGGTDAVYDMLGGEEGDIGRIQRERMEAEKRERDEVRGKVAQMESATQNGRRTRFPAVDNESRTPRSDDEMRVEAEMLAKAMEESVD